MVYTEAQGTNLHAYGTAHTDIEGSYAHLTVLLGWKDACSSCGLNMGSEPWLIVTLNQSSSTAEMARTPATITDPQSHQL